MKRYKKFFILLGVLAVVILTTLAVKNHEVKKEEIKNTDAVILSVPADSVTSVSWNYSVNSFAFTKTDKWHKDGDDSFPVDETALNKLISFFESFGASFIIENVEDYGQYGLEKPVSTIEFTADGKDYAVSLGNFSSLDSQRYVSVGDGNVYLVKKDPLDTFNIQLSKLFLYDTVPSFGTVTELSFSGSENYTLRREEESSAARFDDDCYYTELNGETLPLDTSLVNSYCKTVSGLNLSNYVGYQVTDEELAAWGLTDPKLNVTVVYLPAGAEEDAETETFVLHIGLDREQLAKKEEAEKNGEEYTSSVTAYARVGESLTVYELTSANYNSVAAAGINDLRHKEAAAFETNTVVSFDIVLDGSSYKITSYFPVDEEGVESEVRTFAFNGEDVSADDIKSKLNSLSVSEFTDEEPSGKEELRLTVTLEGANFESYELVIYRLDGTGCLAAANGKTLGRISRSAAVNLIEAIYKIVLG